MEEQSFPSLSNGAKVSSLLAKDQRATLGKVNIIINFYQVNSESFTTNKGRELTHPSKTDQSFLHPKQNKKK